MQGTSGRLSPEKSGSRSLYQSRQGGSGVACVEANIFLVEDLMGGKFVSNRILTNFTGKFSGKLMVRTCAGKRGCCSSEPCSWQSCAWCCCRRGPRAEKNQAGETGNYKLLSKANYRFHPVAVLCSCRGLQAEVELVLPDTSPLSGFNQLQLTSALISSVCY